MQIDGCCPLVRGADRLSTWKQNMAYRISHGLKMLIKGSPVGGAFLHIMKRTSWQVLLNPIDELNECTDMI